MKEGRMRCDEEGSSGKVTRMDGRSRIQDKVAADNRKDSRILGIVTIDRDSEILNAKDERSSATAEEGSPMETTKSEKEEKVKFTVKESKKKLRSHTPEQEEYLLKLSKEDELDTQQRQRPISALGAVVKNDVIEDAEV